MNIADGTYAARPKAASVYEGKSGALILALVHAFEGGGEIKSYHALTTRDGAINTRAVEDLKKWSGWDGSDPYWFMDSDLTGIDVELVIANEEYEGRKSPKVKWVNRPGSGSGTGLPDASDRRAVLAKYGAKFRAVAGPQPVSARAPSNPPPQTAPVRPPAAAPRKTAATQSSAWARLSELGAGMGRPELEALWFSCVDSTGMDQADMTPEGWAQVTEAVEAHFSGSGLSSTGNDDDNPMPF